MAEDVNIFISYGRDESVGPAGRIADWFIEQFGEDRVFRDIVSLEPGLDFAKAIKSAVNSSEVLIAVIGKNWLDATDATGRKRLENPDDYVRIEIATALQRDIRVIPVLVQGASMPRVEELPKDLASLARRDAFVIHDTSWSDDVRTLTTMLTLDQHERAARQRYRQAVNHALGREWVEYPWGEAKVRKASVERLVALAQELGLSVNTAAQIEREVVGVTKEDKLKYSDFMASARNLPDTQEPPQQTEPKEEIEPKEDLWIRLRSLLSRKPATYDVFISYRRKDGAEVARSIYYALKAKRKRVFMDVDDLTAGHFDQALLTIVGNTRNFVVILTPHALDQAVEKQDWLRQEIVQAIKTDTNIIPVMMPRFQFPKPETLPEDIKDLTTYQGVSYQHEYFEAMVKKLVGYLR